VKDIHGKTWTKGEMIQVVSIEKCFEDWCDWKSLTFTENLLY
jgi:hypothetical protein